MKQRIYSFLMAVVLLFGAGFLTMSAQGKAKKPHIELFPSLALCNEIGAVTKMADDMGDGAKLTPDYDKCFLNGDLKAAISKFEEMMRDRDFPVVSLEQERMKLQANPKYKGQPVDIRVEVYYKVHTSGPSDRIQFEIKAFDAYSNKPIANASGTGEPTFDDPVASLLQTAVLNYMDKFCNDLQKTFEQYIVDGRETELLVEASEGKSLEQVIGGKTIAEHVEDWLTAHCVKQAFSTDSQDEEQMSVSQAMMPVFDERGKALDAGSFYKGLLDYLRSLGLQVKKSEGRTASNTSGRLGSAVLTIQ